MTTKDEEYFRLQKNIVHISRHENLVKRISDFVDEMKEKADITPDDKEKWEELMEEQLESLHVMFMDQSEELRHYKTHHNHVTTALRYYVKEYGGHLISKSFSPNAFMTTVTILPVNDEQTSIAVEINVITAKENDD